MKTKQKYPYGEEAKSIIDLCLMRIKIMLGVILLFSGETGRGKSYAGLRFLEIWYKTFFNELFPIKHVCNNIEEAILLTRSIKRKGEGILIEELSVHASVRDSLTTQNKMWNKFCDICLSLIHI